MRLSPLILRSWEKRVLSIENKLLLALSLSIYKDRTVLAKCDVSVKTNQSFQVIREPFCKLIPLVHLKGWLTDWLQRKLIQFKLVLSGQVLYCWMRATFRHSKTLVPHYGGQFPILRSTEEIAAGCITCIGSPMNTHKKLTVWSQHITESLQSAIKIYIFSS